MQAGQSAGDEAARSLRAAEEHRRLAKFHDERAAAFARGRQGEIATGHALDALAADGYLRIDDCRWPGRAKANIDHVLVGPAGLFVIDAKNWSGKVDVRNGVLRQNGYRRAREVDAAHEAACAIETLVPFAVPRAEGLICLAGEAQLPMTRIGNTTVGSASDVAGWLRSQPVALPPEAVSAIFTALSTTLRSANHSQRSQPVSPIPDYVPSHWPAGAAVREPAARPGQPANAAWAGRPVATHRQFRSSRRAAIVGRLLLILLVVDGIGSALLGHSQQIGALIVAVACLAWLVRLEHRRPMLTMVKQSQSGRRRR
jgi:hypothetical protein